MLLTKEALNSMMLFSEPKPSQYPDGNDHVIPSVEYMNDVFRTVVIFFSANHLYRENQFTVI
ncbi:Uncharacterised protein [Salmonella sp. NCTC 11881]|nr:Uncharacterised protein [Salmonella sp. NCTC 11881]